MAKRNQPAARAPATTAVKALGEDGRVGGYLVVWGGPDHRDLQGEYFTPDSELGLDWYPRRPVLYHHGLDGELGPVMIGQIEVMQPDDTGVWVEAQLERRNRWAQAVLDLIQRGTLGWSSGSLPHLVAVAADGHIRRWPIVEGSLTPTPAEPRFTDAVTVKAAFAALGLPTDRIDNYPPQGEEGTNMTDQWGNNGDRGPDRGPSIKRLPAAQSAPRPSASVVTVGSRYDGLSAVDMAFMHTWLSRSGQWSPSTAFMRELAHKAYRAVEQGELDAGAVRALPVKADELMHTASAGYGQEWVPDIWSTELWHKARTENVILPLFRVIEMPSSPFELPISGTDPVVYYVPETSDEDDLTLAGAGNPIPDSPVGSGKVTLTAKKLALRVGFSGELAEDAAIPLIPLYREQALRVMADAIDNVLLNGDTESGATGNINSDDAQPSSTAKYLAFDGLRKLALANNANDAGAAPTVSLLRETRFLMPPKYALQPKNCAWIVDGSTYAALLSDTSLATVDKFGPYATVLTGEIAKVDGVPVLVSAEMPLTQADGKANATGNTKGQAVCCYRPGWVVGYRRRVAATMTYLPYYDAYQMVATVRLAFANFDDDVAAVLYDITV